MLTKRASLLTILGLFTTYLASAQTTAASGPQPTDILGWLAWFVAAVVLLFGVMTATSLAAVAAEAVEADLHDQPAPAGPAVAKAPVAAPAPTTTVSTEQLVAA
ncbi:hypothetical protein [Hymenobacter chitinivorans]|uniref:Uncharacterized protein n=1 Tax=Hymenobacter chitinivorans DSM 11115 TaxID=1121954 RepID=A0A2M9BPA1_9BACT|nr:hypothetical protein [Hymenobacter chitinivorans]PJJ59750.1 hypothetical protein CLV45_1172 [Hymenobacter chitinivorans DSM 11115]